MVQTFAEVKKYCTRNKTDLLYTRQFTLYVLAAVMRCLKPSSHLGSAALSAYTVVYTIILVSVPFSVARSSLSSLILIYSAMLFNHVLFFSSLPI